MRAASSTIDEIKARRGGPGDDNVHIRQAHNTLEQARLQLEYSEVRAERAGVVGNLQLSPGAYLQAGTSVMALVEDNADVTADFREKALRYAQPGTTASVVFDARPGEIFAAKVSHLESGVKEGQIDANGDLAAPTAIGSLGQGCATPTHSPGVQYRPPTLITLWSEGNRTVVFQRQCCGALDGCAANPPRQHHPLCLLRLAAPIG